MRDACIGGEIVRQISPIACTPNFQNVFWLVIINAMENIVVFVPAGFGMTASAIQSKKGKNH